jgi:hypothetical protein
MPTIDKDAKTVRIVCQERNVVHARQVIQEILDDNPGYTPVLVVEDPMGNQITHTDLSAPAKSRSSKAEAEEPAEDSETDEVAEPIEEPAEVVAEEPATEEEAVEDTSDEESTDEEATEEEA